MSVRGHRVAAYASSVSDIAERIQSAPGTRFRGSDFGGVLGSDFGDCWKFANMGPQSPYNLYRKS
eukprot:335242-Rhodomonas_salina.1